MMWVEWSMPRKRSRWPAGLRWEEAGMEVHCIAVARVVPWSVKWVERMRVQACYESRMWLPCCWQRDRETWWLREWALCLTAGL